MHPEFWQDRWVRGQIGFHQPSTSSALIKHWGSITAPGERVFIPLCGKSLDMLWLRDQGHSIEGVELSNIAVEAFCVENGIAARRRIGTPLCRYEAPDLVLLQGDFFAVTPELLGAIPAVYDRAALISWPPELRGHYVVHLSKLANPGTRILLVTLEYSATAMIGPPFSVDADEVRRLYSRDHTIEELGRREILGDEPRMRARGLTSLVEVCYRLTHT